MDEASERLPKGNEDYGARPVDANANGSISDPPEAQRKKSVELTIIGLGSSDSWIDVSEESAFERMKLAG